MGLTSTIANVVPLVGLFMRDNIERHIPPECVGVREYIMKSTPCFKYGYTLDNCVLKATAVARDVEHNDHCICANSSLFEYVVRIKDGSDCMLTTNGGCMNKMMLTQYLILQAGVRSDYAMDMERKPFYIQLVNTIETYAHDLYGPGNQVCRYFRVEGRSVHRNT